MMEEEITEGVMMVEEETFKTARQGEASLAGDDQDGSSEGKAESWWQLQNGQEMMVRGK